MGKHSRQSSVRSHTRTVKGKQQQVRSHSRKTTWTDSKKAAVAAGAGALVFTATAVEIGFQIATILLLVIAAVIGVIFTVANGGSKGTKRGKSVSRRLLAPQSKKGRARSKSQNRGAFTCSRCKGKFSNPLMHVCRIKWSKTKTQQSRQRSKAGGRK